MSYFFQKKRRKELSPAPDVHLLHLLFYALTVCSPLFFSLAPTLLQATSERTSKTELEEAVLSPPFSLPSHHWQYTSLPRERLDQLPEEIDPSLLLDQIVGAAIAKSRGPIDSSFTAIASPTSLSQQAYAEQLTEANEALNQAVGGNVFSQTLGEIETPLGMATLALMTLSSNRGEVKILQAIVVHQGMGHQLTGSAPVEEFSERMGDFLHMIRSYQPVGIDSISK